MAYAATGDIDDEREVMARVAGGLWLMAAVVALGGLLVPGAGREHPAVLLALMVPIGIHGVSCLLAVPWTRVSLTMHAVSSMLMFPLIGVGLWATGGTDSYLRPLLLLAALFIGYFYPSPWRPLLVAELVVVAGAPFLVDFQQAIDDNFLRWYLSFAAAAVGATVAISQLKQRLVRAERRQRAMAHRDPLTGVANRRAFDAAVEAAIVSRRPFALLVIDLDDFKGINDTWGHPAGDQVLQHVAACFAAVVRTDDVLARIGGDEFAVVAPGAGPPGAQRMALALEEAVGHVRRGGEDSPVRATVSSAACPSDGQTAEELMQVADRALHARKRAQRRRAS